MERQLEGRIAIVTGAGRGIGRAIAITLAKAGVVVGLVARSHDQLEEAHASIKSQGGTAVILPGDVSKRPDVERIVREMVKPYDALDIIVNNAGVHTAVGPVGEDDPEAWWHDVKVNLLGPYLLCHFALPHMKSPATIVNTASGAGIAAFPNSTSYGASKAALIHFSESLATELQPRGISVFAIRPGAVRTSITNILSTPAGKRYLAHIAELFEDGSELLVPPERAAELVLRLCSQQAAVLSGRMISVLDDLDQLIREAKRVKEEQLYVLRLNTL